MKILGFVTKQMVNNSETENLAVKSFMLFAFKLKHEQASSLFTSILPYMLKSHSQLEVVSRWR